MIETTNLIALPEIYKQLLRLMDCKTLNKIMSVCKAWLVESNTILAERLSRQKELLPQSFKLIEDKNYTISTDVQANISLTIDPEKATLCLNSLDYVMGEYEEYTLTLYHGQPIELKINNSIENAILLKENQRMKDFFSTLTKSLSKAKIENGFLQISGIHPYIAKARCEIFQ